MFFYIDYRLKIGGSYETKTYKTREIDSIKAVISFWKHFTERLHDLELCDLAAIEILKIYI